MSGAGFQGGLGESRREEEGEAQPVGAPGAMGGPGRKGAGVRMLHRGQSFWIKGGTGEWRSRVRGWKALGVRCGQPGVQAWADVV